MSMIKSLLAATIMLLPFYLSAAETSFHTDTIMSAPQSGFTRRHVARSAVSIGLGLGVNASVTELLKKNINRTRPDGSDRNSFPSRHTSWAFTLSTAASNELYAYSPWWVSGLHTAANVVGFQRVLARHHHPSDVLTGAFTGTASAELGYILGRLIIKDGSWHLYQGVSETSSPSFDVTTDGIIPLGPAWTGPSGDKIKFHTGIGSTFRGILPVNPHFFLTGSLFGRTYSVKEGTVELKPFSVAGLNAGAGIRTSFTSTSPWSAEGMIETGAGMARNPIGRKNVIASYNINVSGSVVRQLSGNFACGVSAGYMMMTVPQTVSAIALGVFSRAVF